MAAASSTESGKFMFYVSERINAMKNKGEKDPALKKLEDEMKEGEDQRDYKKVAVEENGVGKADVGQLEEIYLDAEDNNQVEEAKASTSKHVIEEETDSADEKEQITASKTASIGTAKAKFINFLKAICKPFKLFYEWITHACCIECITDEENRGFCFENFLDCIASTVDKARFICGIILLTILILILFGVVLDNEGFFGNVNKRNDTKIYE